MPIVIGTIESTVVVDDKMTSGRPERASENREVPASGSAQPTARGDMDKLMSIRFQARSAATDWR